MVRSYPTDTEPTNEKDRQPTPQELQLRIIDQARRLASFARDPREGDQEVTLWSFERAIRGGVFQIGCTAVALFLACCEERIRARTTPQMVSNRRRFQRKPAKARTIMTWFGSVRYWRTYMAQQDIEKGEGQGFFPLDLQLGLTAEGFSFSVLNVTVRLITTLSFATAKSTAELFLPEVPSVKVIERATLGFGRFTTEWFEQADPPDLDEQGDVLVILFDGKGTPQATEEELNKRRRPWKDRPRASSPRHRERQRRDRRAKKKPKAKDDKSKNARMATMVVMYTLRTAGSELHGPIGKWHYASFAPKKHAFAIAWREAKKRGFDPESDDVIQIVTDGDPDLARYTKLFFPNAIHTLDVMHAIERLSSCSRALFESDSQERQQWFESQKDQLYRGEIKKVISELRARRRALCRSKKNENRREKLMVHIEYLEERVEMMNYAELLDEDLEIGSGAVEGAVKHIIEKRCDQGGMRWIVERNEAVVQLRCIEVNGDWDRFAAFVHEKLLSDQLAKEKSLRLQQKIAESLPDVLEPQGWKVAA